MESAAKNYTWPGNPHSLTPTVTYKGGFSAQITRFEGKWSVFHFVAEANRHNGLLIDWDGTAGNPPKPQKNPMTGQVITVRFNIGANPPQGGYLAANLWDQAGAIDSYRKALAIRESLAAVNPGDFEMKHLFFYAHGKLSELLQQAGNHEEAMEHLLKLLPIAEMLAARDPGNVKDQRNVASAYIDLGSKQNETGDWKAGLDNSRKGVALFEKLAAAHPGDVLIQRLLAVAYERTGQIIATNTESYGEALALFRKELAVAERLYAAAPGTINELHDCRQPQG